jgi:O-acetyl-ADP-ribose deacetylase (regulator of RNase III)
LVLKATDIIVGNILDSDADAIVFSAHPSLMAGSGVSGVIHKAAGQELEKAAKAFAPIKQGESIVTAGFNLNTKYVIHTVCPRCIYGSEEERDLLTKAYSSALTAAKHLDVRSVSFVAMGIGIYRWPVEVAAQIAVEQLLNTKLSAVSVYVVEEAIKSAYLRAIAELQGDG